VEGTLTASEKGTAVLLGVMVVMVVPFCEKVQIAPEGKESCRHESVIVG